MAKSYASSTTIPLAVIPNPMREMAFRKVDAVKRDCLKWGGQKRTDSISLKASRRNLDGLRLPAPSPSPKATGAAF
jgi:hypothetical protein